MFFFLPNLSLSLSLSLSSLLSLSLSFLYFLLSLFFLSLSLFHSLIKCTATISLESGLHHLFFMRKLLTAAPSLFFLSPLFLLISPSLFSISDHHGGAGTD